MGQVDTTVRRTADRGCSPGGVRTYAASTRPTLNVRFSNGLCLSVPARRTPPGPARPPAAPTPSGGLHGPSNGASCRWALVVSVSASD
jgi:hypothetical protein